MSNPSASAALQWQCPEPLWARFGAEPTAAVAAPDQARPALLRFASDAFMDELLGTLAQDPSAIGALLARPETWRSPPTPVAAPATDPERLRRLPLPSAVRNAARALVRGQCRGHDSSGLASVPDRETRTEQGRARQLPLKLYQPAHQRYYLVGASLVCAQLGFPDRRVRAGGTEQVGFVLRRLLPAADAPDGPLHEHAFVPAATGARWQRVSAGDSTGDPDAVLCPGEEVLPLFPLPYRDDPGHRRTLWAGLLPVGRREEYLGTAVRSQPQTLAAAQLQVLSGAAATPAPDPLPALLAEFQTIFAEPWKALIGAVNQAKAALDETFGEAEEGSADRTARIVSLNLQWQMQSWLLLLDLADYLRTWLPDLWQALEDETPPAAGSPARTLYDWLGGTTNSALLESVIGAPPPKLVAGSLREALVAVADEGVRNGLEAAEILYGETLSAGAADPWPGFHFLLAGLDGHPSGGRPDPAIAGAIVALAAPALADPATVPELAGLVPPTRPFGTPGPGQVDPALVDRLSAAIALALRERTEPATATPPPPLPFALQVRDALAATGSGSDGWMVARCVHLDSGCGPFAPPTLSAPSQRFLLASWFDPDAPARPIRITLPTDTTPAGLRRHQRGTAFVISDLLCGQIQRAKGLGFVDLVRSVLPWPLHKDLELGSGGACKGGDGLNIGMICSLSIPIITICALILLIIMVTLLDIIFRWVPYLITCFPVPGLSGKGGNR